MKVAIGFLLMAQGAHAFQSYGAMPMGRSAWGKQQQQRAVIDPTIRRVMHRDSVETGQDFAKHKKKLIRLVKEFDGSSSASQEKKEKSDGWQGAYFPTSVKDLEEYNQMIMEDQLEEDSARRREVLFGFVALVLTPVVAFMSYESVAAAFAVFISLLNSNNNWVAVDGGAYQAKIIAPAINGVVFPGITILFATLTSTTVSTLRERQVELLKCITKEAGELRALESLLEHFPQEPTGMICREYLLQYTDRILVESSSNRNSGKSYSSLGNLPRRFEVLSSSSASSSPTSMKELCPVGEVCGNTELDGFFSQLHAVKTVAPHVLSETYGSITRLRGYRDDRMTALQSTYPPLHYVILALLSVSQCMVFLMETNQDLLVFLNATQLKILWSMLVSTFTACFCVYFDLLSPFEGTYHIVESVNQIHMIRMSLAGRVVQEQEKRRKHKRP